MSLSMPYATRITSHANSGAWNCEGDGLDQDLTKCSVSRQSKCPNMTSKSNDSDTPMITFQISTFKTWRLCCHAPHGCIAAWDVNLCGCHSFHWRYSCYRPLCFSEPGEHMWLVGSCLEVWSWWNFGIHNHLGHVNQLDVFLCAALGWVSAPKWSCPKTPRRSSGLVHRRLELLELLDSWIFKKTSPFDAICRPTWYWN